MLSSKQNLNRLGLFIIAVATVFIVVSVAKAILQIDSDRPVYRNQDYFVTLYFRNQDKGEVIPNLHQYQVNDEKTGKLLFLSPPLVPRSASQRILIPKTAMGIVDHALGSYKAEFHTLSDTFFWRGTDGRMNTGYSKFTFQVVNAPFQPPITTYTAVPAYTPTPGVNSCCIAHPDTVGCDDPNCEIQICGPNRNDGFDSICCFETWDYQCAQEARGEYTVLGTAHCACAP